MGETPEGNPHEVGRRLTTLCRIDILLNERQREKDIDLEIKPQGQN
jgi:hypothetical protein